jgi:ABC-type nitrate/sulfonate/bicarbonate transport system ATPase subunit
MAVLEIRDLRYVYPGPQPVEAIQNVSLMVRDNEFVSVIGPSGCGNRRCSAWCRISYR